LIFATGDEALCKHLTTSPWIECVTTKRGTSVSTAELRPVAEVHEEMRSKARRAVERLADAKVMQVTTPVRVTVGAVPPAALGLVASLPGLVAAGQRVRFTRPDLGPKTFEQLAAVVMMIDHVSRHQLLVEQLRASPTARQMVPANDSAYFARWLAQEGGARVVVETP
jgi:D-aminopeptidase